MTKTNWESWRRAPASLVIQEVAKRYQPRDLPSRAELYTIPSGSVVIVEVRKGNTGETAELALRVQASIPDGSQVSYYGTILDAPDMIGCFVQSGLEFRNVRIGTNGPYLKFRSDHILRIAETYDDAAENVMLAPPAHYDIRYDPTAVPSIGNPVLLYYDDKLVGIIEAHHISHLSKLLTPHDPDQDPDH